MLGVILKKIAKPLANAGQLYYQTDYSPELIVFFFRKTANGRMHSILSKNTDLRYLKSSIGKFNFYKGCCVSNKVG